MCMNPDLAAQELERGLEGACVDDAHAATGGRRRHHRVQHLAAEASVGDTCGRTAALNCATHLNRQAYFLTYY